MSDLSIRDILEQVKKGQIRIPAFQRGFVWDSDRVAYLMDSIYKKYPFGSLLFWRTKEVLKFDRKLGPFELPQPPEDYPIDYVLDGQQRVTSIYGVFQTDLPVPTDDELWLPIYFDISAAAGVQDSQFIALPAAKVDPSKHFPLSTLFDTVAYRKATDGRDDNIKELLDRVQETFKEVKIPVQVSSTQDKATVAIIFERVNRQGVALNTLQLLSAWTWSEDFQLQDQFAELSEELTPFGFEEVGGDTNLLMRCCSAIMKGDASPQALMNMNGAEVRGSFDKVINGVKYAVDYMRKSYKAEKLNNLPFTTMLVPMSVFFAVKGDKEARYSDAQRRSIDTWFWRSAFSRRYSSAVLRNLNSDIEQMQLLRDNKTNSLGDFVSNVAPEFFLTNYFGISYVNTKTFVLLLATAQPKSFISGANIDLARTLKEANRTEFHHLMPKAFLRETSLLRDGEENMLANFAFLSRADNRDIGGARPSEYRKKMPPNQTDVDLILRGALTPKSLFDDRFREFVNERAVLLASVANNLCNNNS